MKKREVSTGIYKTVWWERHGSNGPTSWTDSKLSRERGNIYDLLDKCEKLAKETLRKTLPLTPDTTPLGSRAVLLISDLMQTRERLQTLEAKFPKAAEDLRELAKNSYCAGRQGEMLKVTPFEGHVRTNVKVQKGRIKGGKHHAIDKRELIPRLQPQVDELALDPRHKRKSITWVRKEVAEANAVSLRFVGKYTVNPRRK